MNGEWGEWADWSACTASCGTGYKVRSRKIARSPNECGTPLEGLAQEFEECNSQACDITSVDCLFSEWSEYDDCSCPCNGIQDRTRRITTYAQGEGALCEGALKEVRACNLPDGNTECGPNPVDCVMSEWSSWGQCTSKCGGGSQTRSRTVLTPPSNGGKPCEGQLSEVQGCNNQVCTGAVDCEWGEWHHWGACSKHCGGGQKSRFRHVTTMAKLNGEPCDYKASAEVVACNDHACGEPLYCGWNAWTAWTTCSASCGPGLKERKRELGLTPTKPDSDGGRDGFVILDSLSLPVFFTQPMHYVTQSLGVLTGAVGFFNPTILLFGGVLFTGVIFYMRRVESRSTPVPDDEMEFRRMGLVTENEPME